MIGASVMKELNMDLQYVCYPFLFPLCNACKKYFNSETNSQKQILPRKKKKTEKNASLMLMKSASLGSTMSWC